MGPNGAARYVKVWLELLPVDEGGRRTPLDLSSEWPVAYKPQLRVHGGSGKLLDVEFVAGPSEPIAPGSGAAATLRLPQTNGATHSELVTGAEFDIWVDDDKIMERGQFLI